SSNLSRRPSVGGVPVGGAGDRQSEIVAQGRAGIVLLEKAAALQFGYEQAHDVVVVTRHVGRREHKAVAGRRAEPFLPLFGAPFGIATEHVVLLDRAAARHGDKIAPRRVLLAGMPDPPVTEPLER